MAGEERAAPGGSGEGKKGLWGGRFEGGMARAMEPLNRSLDLDRRFWRHDIRGSRAWATALADAEVLTGEERKTLHSGLDAVAERLDGADFSGFPDEDVHSLVERLLFEEVGEVAGKLHTARSRNDQVATDVRLWLRRRLELLDDALVDLLAAFLERVEGDGEILMPGYTHLQRGQPILLGHHLLAHAWPLVRDRERLADARRRLDRSPLGACAMAGTPHRIDRRSTAEMLGFAGVLENAMDAVAARDHEQEVAAACAICLGHLSRQAEELVLWSSSEFRFVRVGETFATGSSIMPQKRNPDAAELLRGKVARGAGAFQELLVLTKGLPLAYNRDLQDDREPLFDAVETTIDAVRIAAGMWRTLTFDPERFEDELRGDFSLATELADLLVERGVAFREAHEVVGRIVRWCEENERDLSALADGTVDAADAFHPRLHGDLSPVLDPRQAVERRTSRGGTAWPEVERQVELLAELLGERPAR